MWNKNVCVIFDIIYRWRNERIKYKLYFIYISQIQVPKYGTTDEIYLEDFY